MIVLGLTGSIAMGKSTIGVMLLNMNIPVHEADHAVHDLLKIKSPARPAIVAAFPYYEFPQIYDRKSKDIDRKELGALVFHDSEHRKTLEDILHPLVQKEQTKFIRAAQSKGLDMVCLDIPLLFETGADQRVDYTMVTSAPYNIQRERALSRPSMNEEKLHAILQRQMPDKEKCARADFVIKTGLNRAHSQKQVQMAINAIRDNL